MYSSQLICLLSEKDDSRLSSTRILIGPPSCSQAKEYHTAQSHNNCKNGLQHLKIPLCLWNLHMKVSKMCTNRECGAKNNVLGAGWDDRERAYYQWQHAEDTVSWDKQVISEGHWNHTSTAERSVPVILHPVWLLWGMSLDLLWERVLFQALKSKL